MDQPRRLLPQLLGHQHLQAARGAQGLGALHNSTRAAPQVTRAAGAAGYGWNGSIERTSCTAFSVALSDAFCSLAAFLSRDLSSSTRCQQPTHSLTSA